MAQRDDARDRTGRAREKRARGRSSDAEAAAELPQALAPGHAELLHLQTAAGNRAVRRLLHPAESAQRPARPAPAARPPLGREVVQRASLSDYSDASKPEHDPAKISDADIKATDEFRLLLLTYGFPYFGIRLFSEADILLACRLVIRRLREGGSFDTKRDALTFLQQAQKQLGTVTQVETGLGDFTWSAQALDMKGTEFGKWLVAGGKEPDPKKGNMNCWEVVLFGAYKAGYVDDAWLKAFYTDLVKNLGAAAVVMADQTIETKLKSGGEQEFKAGDPKSPEPLVGDIVVFSVALSHTAISLGTKDKAGEHEILSLWNKPKGDKFLQKTTIEELLRLKAKTPVRFFAPKW